MATRGCLAIDSVLIGGIGLLAAIPQFVRMQAGLLDLMRRFDSEVSRAGNTGTAPDVDIFLRTWTWCCLWSPGQHWRPLSRG